MPWEGKRSSRVFRAPGTHVDRGLLTCPFCMSTPPLGRFQAWNRAGVWPRLHRAVLDAHGAAGDVDWSAAIVDAASLRAKKGGPLTGPNPVDRGKPGSKIHVLSDGGGLPLVVGVSAANLYDRRKI